MPGITISVGSQRNLSNNFVVDGLSANDDAAGLSGITYGVDAIEQFQVITSGAQAELGRALGGYVNVVTKSGTNNLRGTVYDFFRDDSLNASERAVGNDAADAPVAVRRERRRAVQQGPDLLLRQRRAARSRSDRPGDDLGRQRRGDQRAAERPPATAGRRSAPASIPTRCVTTNVLAKIDHQFSGRDQFSIRYSRYDVTATNARGAGGLSAPTASSNLDNADQPVAIGNTLVLSSRTFLETRAQFARGDLQAPPSDLIGPAVSIAGVATFGTSSTSPTGRLNTHVSDRQQPVAPARRACAARRRRLPLQRRPDHLSAIGSRQLHLLVAREFPDRRLQQRRLRQTFGITELAQTNPEPRHLRAGRMEAVIVGDAQRRRALRPAVARDASTPTPTTCRRASAWPGRRRNRAARSCAAAPGLFYDRVPLRALANALMSAGNTTDVTRSGSTS